MTTPCPALALEYRSGCRVLAHYAPKALDQCRINADIRSPLGFRRIKRRLDPDGKVLTSTQSW
jgi:hypothetical protein